jgi:anti-sigma factor RsiW
MRQVQIEELSALLDGELDPGRAEEVRAGIEADPLLREEFAMLVRLDARLRGAAERTGFMPEVSLPVDATSKASVRRWPIGIAGVLALIVARFLPKLTELPLFGFGLQLAVCAAIVFIVIAMARETEPPLATPAAAA